MDTGEAYDLIVVGAGLAGLAAAHVYKKERGGNARILLLENNDDFGGHARRNTFKWNDTTLIVNGGTYDLEAPENSPPEAREILDDLGIEIEREIRTELDHVLGPWGFQAATDIKAITVNRWAHGYIVFPHPDVHSPHRVRGRQRIGRISFAGADAAGSPWTQGAFKEAHRAVHEQLAL